jgi:endonuclease/exonuclease/phosphatase (EEP) superfamily protein YafD
MEETIEFWAVGEALVYLIGLVGIAMTSLPLVRHGAWWIRIGDFPRLQIAFGCALILALMLIFGRPLSTYDLVFCGILTGCIFYQLYCILPYLPIYPKQVEKTLKPNAENVIKLYICNILIENKNTQKLQKQIERINPDIIVLAEPDEYWARELEPLHQDYSIVISKPLDNAYGLILYSRLELIKPELKFLVEDDIPSIHTDVRLPSGKIVKLYCLHPRPPMPGESLRSNERDAELLIVGRAINKKDEPTIVCGDLNDVAWSRTTKLFQKISGLLDPRIGRGLYSSFHAGYPPIRFPLDHVFHSNHFRLVDIKRLSSVDSDHFPIYIELSLEATAELTQEEPEATAEEHKEAIETIQETYELIAEEKEDAESVRQAGL